MTLADWLKEKEAFMKQSFTAILTQFPSCNITFQELSEDGNLASTSPTRYGRHLFGKYVQIVAVLQDGVQFMHPAILLSEQVYAAIAATGSRTND